MTCVEFIYKSINVFTSINTMVAQDMLWSITAVITQSGLNYSYMIFLSLRLCEFFIIRIPWKKISNFFLPFALTVTVWLFSRAQKKVHIFLIIVNYILRTCPNLKHRFLLDTFTPARNRSYNIFIRNCFTKGYYI